jgi:hypothetical protein
MSRSGMVVWTDRGVVVRCGGGGDGMERGWRDGEG